MMIKIETSDGKLIDAELELVRRFGTLNTLIDALELECNESTVLPLPNVSEKILILVLIWARYHKNDPVPIQNQDTFRQIDDVEQWDRHFLNVDHGTLGELVLASLYLDIKDLYIAAIKIIKKMTSTIPIDYTRVLG